MSIRDVVKIHYEHEEFTFYDLEAQFAEILIKEAIDTGTDAVIIPYNGIDTMFHVKHIVFWGKNW